MKQQKEVNRRKRKLPGMISREVFNLPRGSIYILADLWKAKRPLSISQIAERNGIAWKTANEHINTLKERGFIKITKTVRRTYCQIKKEFMDSIGSF